MICDSYRTNCVRLSPRYPRAGGAHTSHARSSVRSRPHCRLSALSLATALVVGCRFYGGCRLRLQRDGRNPIVRLRREHECLEARPRKGSTRIATPGWVQLRVRDDIFQVGIFGPAIAHDLRGSLLTLSAPSLMLGCEQEFLTCQAALASGAQAQTNCPCCGSSSSGNSQ